MPSLDASRIPSRLAIAILAVLLCYFGEAARAHEATGDARVHLFVRPAGDEVEMLARIPLDALPDIDLPRRAGAVLVSRADRAIRHAAQIWIADQIEPVARGRALPPARIVATRIARGDDGALASFERARAGVLAPALDDAPDLDGRGLQLDVLLAFPALTGADELALRLRFTRIAQRVTTSLRYLPPSGGVRAFELHGDPGLVALDPGLLQTAARFLIDGARHILGGADHLLFLACIVVPFRRWRPLVVIVSAFTLGHAVLLTAAALGAAPQAGWFAPLVETAIAASILYMAVENLCGARLSRRWGLALAFGLIHGLGFSAALRDELQFSGEHLLVALLFFNVGVETGQLLALAAMLAALSPLLRSARRERIGVAIVSACAALVAAAWMIGRAVDLAAAPAPTFDAAFGAGLAGAAGALAAIGALAFAARRRVARWMTRAAPPARQSRTARV